MAQQNTDNNKESLLSAIIDHPWYKAYIVLFLILRYVLRDDPVLLRKVVYISILIVSAYVVTIINEIILEYQSDDAE